MIDRYLQAPLRRLLLPLASALARSGVSANTITLTGFAVGLIAVAMLSLGFFGEALAAILANRLMDGLDGAVARLNGPSDRGAFLDITLDFNFYALVPLGFAVANPAANALPAATLIAAFVASGSSFLAFAALAAKSGRTAADYPQKGIYYLGGLAEGAETIIVFVLMCLVPDWFAGLAYFFAGICFLTGVTRCVHAWFVFGDT